MENSEIARALHELADLLEMERQPGFRVRAYRGAARAIDGLAVRAIDLLAEDKLTTVPGIGDGIARRIAELCQTGTIADLEERRARMPPGLVGLLRLPGLGPKSAELIWRELGLSTMAEVEEAARAGKLRGLRRFGAVREKRLLAAIEARKDERPRVMLSVASDTARRILDRIRMVTGVGRAETCGSVRRHEPTVGDLDLVVAAPEHACPAAIDRLAGMGDVASVLSRSEHDARVMLRDGLEVDLRVVPLDQWGAAWLALTGSAEHTRALGALAEARGLRLDDRGLHDMRGARVAGTEEEEIYRALGLPWIPPELRQGGGEIAAAAEGRLPRLVELGDMRGDLHVHTSETDGKHTLEEMVRAAGRAGREYLAITDHSQALAITRGLDPERLREQGRQIHELNDRLGGAPVVLHGIEADILPDGSVDLGPEVLGELDWVVASVHSAFRMSREEQTRRLVRALESGVVDVIGHPTGRLLTRRRGYEIDLEQVLAAAKRVGAAIELNAFPSRLDLDETGVRMAKEMGVPVVISTDSHSTRQLAAHMRYGVGIARRGGLEPADIANTLPLKDLRARFSHHHPRARSAST